MQQEESPHDQGSRKAFSIYPCSFMTSFLNFFNTTGEFQEGGLATKLRPPEHVSSSPQSSPSQSAHYHSTPSWIFASTFEISRRRLHRSLSLSLMMQISANYYCSSYAARNVNVYNHLPTVLSFCRKGSSSYAGSSLLRSSQKSKSKG